MKATTAHWASAHEGNQGGVSSDTRNRSYDRNMPARTSAASLPGFLRRKFVKRPRICRPGGFRLAELQYNTVGVDFSALDTLADFGSLSERASESRFARLARGNLRPSSALLPHKREPFAVCPQAFGAITLIATKTCDESFLG